MKTRIIIIFLLLTGGFTQNAWGQECDISVSSFSWSAIYENGVYKDYIHPLANTPQGGCGICRISSLINEAEIRYRIFYEISSDEIYYPMNLSEWGFYTAYNTLDLPDGNYNPRYNNNLCSLGYPNTQLEKKAISSKLKIFAESMIPYRIRLNKKSNSDRNYYHQMPSYIETIDASYITVSNYVNFYNNSTALLNTKTAVDNVKRALMCGDSRIDAGPINIGLNAGSNIVWDAGLNDYTYDHKGVYPFFGQGTWHSVIITGWISKGATNIYLRNNIGKLEKFDWIDIWNLTKFHVALNTVLYNNSNELEDAIGGVFIIRDNHTTGRYFVPYFENKDSSGTTYLAKPRGRVFNFDNYYTPYDHSDDDDIPDYVDNCITMKNDYQKDLDGDNIGDVCDNDADDDGIIYNSNDPYCDKDDRNICIGPDLNDNGLFERSGRVNIPNYTSGEPKILSLSGEGYIIDWDGNLLKDEYFNVTSGPCDSTNCIDRCDDNYDNTSIPHANCKTKCDILEDTTSPFLNSYKKLPVKESFACKYQNYFHPKCMVWTDLILRLKANGFYGNENRLSRGVAKLIYEKALDRTYPDKKDWGPYTLPNLKNLINNYAEIADFYFTPEFNEVLILNDSISVNLADELAKFNPCDLLHQTKLYNFTFNWFDQYNNISEYNEIWWANRIEFKNWIEDRKDECSTYFGDLQGEFPVKEISLLPMTESAQVIPGNDGHNLIQTTCTGNKFELQYEYTNREVLLNTDGNWQFKLIKDRNVRFGGCLCDPAIFQNCTKNCKQDGNTTSKEEIVLNTLTGFRNQSWDPIHNNKKLCKNLEDNSNENYSKFCENKNIISTYNKRSLEFYRTDLYDYDKGIHDFDDPREYPKLTDWTPKQFTVRYSNCVPDYSGKCTDQVSFRKYSQPINTLDSTNCIKKIVGIRNWNPTEINIVNGYTDPSPEIWIFWEDFTRGYLLKYDESTMNTDIIAEVKNPHVTTMQLLDSQNQTFLVAHKNPNKITFTINKINDLTLEKQNNLKISGDIPYLEKFNLSFYDDKTLMAGINSDSQFVLSLIEHDGNNGDIENLTIIDNVIDYSMVKLSNDNYQVLLTKSDGISINILNNEEFYESALIEDNIFISSTYPMDRGILAIKDNSSIVFIDSKGSKITDFSMRGLPVGSNFMENWIFAPTQTPTLWTSSNTMDENFNQYVFNYESMSWMKNSTISWDEF
jgi:hypothetical protein